MPPARKVNPETGLTEKQTAFCYAFIETGNQSEAYRRAYDAGKMTQMSIASEASKLIKRPQLAGMIKALREARDAKAQEKLGLDREWILSRLMKNAEIALGEKPTVQNGFVLQDLFDTSDKPTQLPQVYDRDASAANQALALLGKVDTIGLFLDRSKVTVEKQYEEMTDEELDEFIASKQE
jgi:Terminase small subunit